MYNSEVFTAVYTIEPPAAPAANPPAGNYFTAQNITLASAIAGAKIYYTLDGSTPTAASTLYSAPIAISTAATIKAIAVVEGIEPGAMLTAAYTFDQPAGNTFTVNAFNFDSAIRRILELSGEYVIILTENVNNYPGIVLDTAGVKITIKSEGAAKTISWNHASDPLFSIDGMHLVLENVKLTRTAGKNETWCMIKVSNNNGKLEINNGVEISTNTGTDGIHVRDSILNMSGGKIYNCLGGVNVFDGGTFNMTGGEINNNHDGIYISGNNCEINITDGKINDNGSSGIALFGAYNEVSLTNCEINGNGIDYGWGISVFGSNNEISLNSGIINNNKGEGISFTEWSSEGKLIMTGGTISNSNDGIRINGNDCEITISGGTISDNDNGIVIYGTDCELTITGGVISENNYGILINGEYADINMENGTINGNGNGIGFWPDSFNCTFNMQGGSITNSTSWAGIMVRGNGNTINAKGGTINNNFRFGIVVPDNPINCVIEIEGCEISKGTNDVCIQIEPTGEPVLRHINNINSSDYVFLETDGSGNVVEATLEGDWE